MSLGLTNGDCCCVAPRLMIKIEHLTSVQSSVCCGHTRDLQDKNTEIQNINYTHYTDTETNTHTVYLLSYDSVQIVKCNICNILVSVLSNSSTGDPPTKWDYDIQTYWSTSSSGGQGKHQPDLIIFTLAHFHNWSPKYRFKTNSSDFARTRGAQAHQVPF